MSPKCYVIPVVLVVIAGFCSCKKSDSELLKNETKKAMNAEINKKLAMLKERLGRAETDSQRAEIYVQIAEIQSDKGDHVSSIKSSTNAIKYQPNEYRSHYILGKSFLAAGRYDEAERELVTSIELNDSFAPAHFELGNTYYKKKDYTGSLQQYRDTVRFDPQHYEAYNNMGVLYSLMDDPRKSVESFSSAARLKPDFASVYKNMGIMYDLYLKDSKSAIENYRKYLNLRPNGRDRRLVKSWIDKLGG